MTVAPLLTEDDFLAALQNLLPQGRAWNRDPDSVMTKFLRGIAKAQAAAHARQVNLLTDAFPPSTAELMPEWESTLGLPDPCVGVLPTTGERLAQIVARIKGRGGQSVPYFIAFALDLGFVITIKEDAPSRFGRTFGLPFGGYEWAHTWEVTDPNLQVHYFQFGHDVMGDPFADWGFGVIECELSRIKPGHTILIFNGP